MKILVRNLNRDVTQADLLYLFTRYGKIEECVLVMDAKTGRSKGFGFVEMPLKAEAFEAIKNLDGKSVKGMKIRVKTTNG